MIILDGKNYSKKLKNEIKDEVAEIQHLTSMDFELIAAVSYTHLTLPTTERV